MGHTVAEKDKLLARVRALKDQLGEMEEGFRQDVDPAAVLQLVAKSRLHINGLMADVLEDHLRIHVLQEGVNTPAGARIAAEDLIGVVHAYLGR